MKQSNENNLELVPV